jgi:hypothetical protein
VPVTKADAQVQISRMEKLPADTCDEWAAKLTQAALGKGVEDSLLVATFLGSVDEMTAALVRRMAPPTVTMAAHFANEIRRITLGTETPKTTPRPAAKTSENAPLPRVLKIPGADPRGAPKGRPRATTKMDKGA